MARFSILWLGLLGLILACNQRPTSAEETSPGPVTETDKQRYNLNPSDELLYDSMDSLEVDSLAEDSLLRKE